MRLKSKQFCNCAQDNKIFTVCQCPYKLGDETVTVPVGWRWSSYDSTLTCKLSDDNQTVLFHPKYSNGNACIRGDTPMNQGMQYYWEITILTELYGSSIMIGVGTKDVVLDKFKSDFANMLGTDDQSWGFHYRGSLFHNSKEIKLCPDWSYSQGTLVGVHLDMCRHTLQFYVNRSPVGKAFTNVTAQTLYPMISSTAALSSMKLTYAAACAASSPLSLLHLCLRQFPLASSSKVPHGISKMLAGCWWLLPKSSFNRISRGREAPKQNLGIFLIVDSDDEEEDEHDSDGLLVQRWKRVLENSQALAGPETIRPIHKKMRLNKDA